MRQVTLTRELAHASAWDAGNRSMRAAGRTVWTSADYNACVAEFHRLWPLEREYPWATPEQLAQMRAIEEGAGL